MSRSLACLSYWSYAAFVILCVHIVLLGRRRAAYALFVRIAIAVPPIALSLARRRPVALAMAACAIEPMRLRAVAIVRRAVRSAVVWVTFLRVLCEAILFALSLYVVGAKTAAALAIVVGA